MSQTTIEYIIYYLKAILQNKKKINFSNIALKVSHDGLTRTLSRKYQWQTLYWIFISSLINHHDGYLIIDDTIIEKPYSSLSPFIRYLFSTKENKAIRGIQLVVLIVVVGDMRFPLGFRIYDKSKTKIELALELLSFARNQLGFRKKVVLFDSWYPAKKILKRISAYGWYFVCRIKKNRKVSGKQVQKIFPSPHGMKQGEIGSVKVILVKYCGVYIITNALSLSKTEIRGWYKKRWKIEEFFRAFKSLFNVKDCQSRTIKAWENHLFLSSLSFSFVELKRSDLDITIYKASKSLRLKEYSSYIQRWKTILRNA